MAGESGRRCDARGGQEQGIRGWQALGRGVGAILSTRRITGALRRNVPCHDALTKFTPAAVGRGARGEDALCWGVELTER